ncbi:MAG: ImmA/IrrE family metallo-endopeptidase, partial [Coprobacillaceae bacterium]
EIGHYLLHKEDALLFSYTQLGHRNKLEVEANLFACVKLLENDDLADVNVIKLLQRKGVPEQIAVNFYNQWRKEKKWE